MSQVQLGTLLKGLSINRGGGPDGFSGSRRTYPSAGARYPVDVYLLLLNCEDAATGSYVFDPRAGTMRLVREGSLQEPTLAIFEEPWATRAAAIFVFVAQWVRTEAKYGNRGLAYAYLEAGHMAQNLVLISHELGLGCCPLGGFREPPLTRLLRLVSPEESPVYALAIGCPAP